MGKKAPRKAPLVTAVCIFMLLGFVGNTIHSKAIAACQQQHCDGSCSQVSHGTQATNFGCRKGKCGCKKQRCRCKQKCPKCQNDFCQLERKVGKETKTCFKTEQKIVCIPTVRLPWQKCQPTCSKTRVVNVLKKHKYECPKCEYKWSEYKPEIQQPQENPESQTGQPSVIDEWAPNDAGPQVLEGQQLDQQPFQGQPREAQPFQQPQYDYDALPQSNRRTPFKQEVFDPTGGDVPRPPALKPRK